MNAVNNALVIDSQAGLGKVEPIRLARPSPYRGRVEVRGSISRTGTVEIGGLVSRWCSRVARWEVLASCRSAGYGSSSEVVLVDWWRRKFLEVHANINILLDDITIELKIRHIQV